MKSFLSSLFFIVCIYFSSSAQVDTIEVYSKAMDKNLKAAIVKPEKYSEDADAFRSVYVLHGGSGSFSDWHDKVTEPGLLQKLADQYNILIVTPGVGPSSYYYDSPLLDTVRYETYFTKELIPFIDENYNTMNKREGRAITGLSMGGHGAMMIAAKHPELFIAAGSMSGVMNIDYRMWKVDESFKNRIKEGQKLALGDINYDAPFTEYTAVGLVGKMKENGTALLIDCGVDDFLIATNRQIHQLLLDLNVDHEYTERPGAHTWQYWTEALPFHMLFIDQVFKKNQ
ncbi:putative esterase [Indibacter alkaliphilus LW1]|uniref:Esterase n=1 Tax=Indibacter alkaliphilus (strain CCUG 57479 / KCTC 22604 / LW1) TaxID=1189612 RepID=S2D8Y7_INDAL|nr:alpha/beta hydrolase family protein [Indibacter alkaliphilus]EOZ95379.1 putative esterase [Indibacter alkaliphilus LW1]